MRLLFWVATLCVVIELTSAIENKKPAATENNKRVTKDVGDDIRDTKNLQYSLVLPHSRVESFRSTNRRISNIQHFDRSGHALGSYEALLPGQVVDRRGRPSHLPPYAVQMEPMVQYSQKDPLYDARQHDHFDGSVAKNDIQAQPKILNLKESGDLFTENNHISENIYGPPFGGLPSAPLYNHPQHRIPYYEHPEPIIEIIIKESNESLPEQPILPPPPAKKDPVQVFYVKYSKDRNAYGKEQVVYEKPIPAVTPPTNIEEHHRETEVAPPLPPVYSAPQPSTTLRTIIKPDSETYISESGVRVTFGTEHRHHDEERDVGPEGHEETAPQPAVAYLNSPPQLTSGHDFRPQFQERRPGFLDQQSRPTQNSNKQFAQQRIQFQPTFLPVNQQLPYQITPKQPFKGQQQPFPRPNSQPVLDGSASARPSNKPPSSFQYRPSPSPPLSRGQPFPPQNHPSNQRPFHPGPQPQTFFNEHKYLQENYHTITSDQVEPPKEQLLPSRPPQNFHHEVRAPTVEHPISLSQEEYNTRYYQQLQQHTRFPSSASNNFQAPDQRERPVNKFYQSTSGPSSSTNNSPATQQYFTNPNGQVQQIQREQTRYTQNPQINFSQQPTVQADQPVRQQFLAQQTHSHQSLNQNLPSQQPSQVNYRLQAHPQQPPQFEKVPTTQNQQSQVFHQENIRNFAPNGGELVASIPKFEQHILVNGDINSDPTFEQQFGQQHQLQKQHQQERQKQTPQDIQQQQHQQQINHQQEHQKQQQQQQLHQQSQQSQSPNGQLSQHELRQQVQQQFYDDAEQQQLQAQLAQNVRKQQEEILRLQSQLLQSQQLQKKNSQQKIVDNNYQISLSSQQNQESLSQYKPQQQLQNQQQVQYVTPQSSGTGQYQAQSQGRNPQRQSIYYSTSTSKPQTYSPTTSRTINITPTTQRYSSSTAQSASTPPEQKKPEKKRPAFELPDEVPDDLRQQLLSSGILDNADISVLDYDKVGDTSLDQLPADQLANFFSAGGGQQIAASKVHRNVVRTNGEKVTDLEVEGDAEDDQELAASENVASYILPNANVNEDVEMKVVHFDPSTAEGQQVADHYVRENATHLEPVNLNDNKYNRYLPLKVSGNQFPIPDIPELKGRKVTSVVVLAPVNTEALPHPGSRSERDTGNKLQGIKFAAGDSLQRLLKDPTAENYKNWLEREKKTSSDMQSVILLVTESGKTEADKEIFMYDVASSTVSKLSGDLSTAFVEAAENNAGKDIDTLAIAGDGTREDLKRPKSDVKGKDEVIEDDIPEDVGLTQAASEQIEKFADFSSSKIELENSNQVSISSGYSKTKMGRSQ